MHSVLLFSLPSDFLRSKGMLFDWIEKRKMKNFNSPISHWWNFVFWSKVSEGRCFCDRSQMYLEMQLQKKRTDNNDENNAMPLIWIFYISLKSSYIPSQADWQCSEVFIFLQEMFALQMEILPTQQTNMFVLPARWVIQMIRVECNIHCCTSASEAVISCAN